MLPALIATAERQHRDAVRRLAASRDLPVGTEFALEDQTYRRCAGTIGRVYVENIQTRRRQDLANEEERAFWSWAIVEVLRIGSQH
ncbi:MAG: hypothetical protein DLM61_20705 [Pseudonocardiales bacterium]|nr:MAG: hypothetical protein DLM61_20705 [Pseudonocardiales bacterium]